MQQPTFKRRIVILLLLAATSSVVVAWFAFKYANSSPMPFERARWMQARKIGDERLLNRMSKDLIQRNSLIGQTRSQLIDLLGDPETYTDATGRQMYYLIREDIDGIDPARRDQLLISLDQNGRAVQARIDVWRKNQSR